MLAVLHTKEPDLQVVKDSAFLDLNSPMTMYEVLKAILLLPWVLVKLTLSIGGLSIVWIFIQVRDEPEDDI